MSRRRHRSMVFLRVAAVVLLLAGGGRVRAVGTWSVLASRVHPDFANLDNPDYLAALAVDSRGNLYVADQEYDRQGHLYHRILKRDAQGDWSILRLTGPHAEPVLYPFALAVDGADNLYVGEYHFWMAPRSRVLKRDPGGHWTVLALNGPEWGQVYPPAALATDDAGNLYLADYDGPGCESQGRVQKRDPQGNWSVLAGCGAAPGPGAALGPLNGPVRLTADGAGRLYVMDGPDETGSTRLMRRDAQGNWTVLDRPVEAFDGRVSMTADRTGNLYVSASGRIQKRDAAGHWTELVPPGRDHLSLAIAADDSGGLYVADINYSDSQIRLLKRDDRGTWSRLTPEPPSGSVASPRGVALDRGGNLYVADAGNLRVQRRDPQGNWTNLTTVGTGPGQVLSPYSVSVDALGNLYVAETGRNPRLQQRDPQGNWTVLATGGTGLGQVYGPAAVAADGAGGLYVAEVGMGSDEGYGRIQKRDPAGNWTVIATSGMAPGQVTLPVSLAVDGGGSLYVADMAGPSLDLNRRGRVQKRDVEGNWTVVAPYGRPTSRVNNPFGLAVDDAGTLYVSDLPDWGGVGRSRLQRRTADGTWTDLGDWNGVSLAIDGQGSFYTTFGGADGRVQRWDALGNWTTLTTSGLPLGQVRAPGSVAVDRAGKVYVTDGYVTDYYGMGGRVQMRDASGAWTVIASPGTEPGRVIYPRSLAVDDAGNLYVADAGNARVQQRDPAGSWTVLATPGTGLGQVNGPTAVASGGGNLYVADYGRRGKDGTEGRVQRRDARGNWTEIATAGTALGWVSSPMGLAADDAGNLYVADRGGRGEDGSVRVRIQRRDPEGNWTEIATVGSRLDPSNYWLTVTSMTVDGAGNLYVADDGNHRVAKRSAEGVWTGLAIAGSAVGQVHDPAGLAVDRAGGLYVADRGNHRVQKYTVTGEDLLPGDLDGDRKVSLADVELTLEALVGFVALTPDQAAAADVDRDGRVAVTDVGLILRVAVGVLSRFP